MKSKQLLCILVAAVVVVIIGLTVNRSTKSSWSGGSDAATTKVLPDFPINDVTKIEITSSEDTIALERKDGKWRVTDRFDYPADYGKVSEFVRDLAELGVAEVIKLGESQYGRLELLEPDKGENSGTKVAFYGAGNKALGSLLLGKEHERKTDASAPPMGGMGGMGGMMGGMGGGSFPDGRFILLPETNQVILVSETFSTVKPSPEDWLVKDFFKIGDVEYATLTRDGKEVYRVEREKKGEDPKLVGLQEGEEQDDSKVRSVANAFSWASFGDIADPALTPEDTGLDSPAVFAARDFDGFVYTVKAGKETEDSKYYVAVEAVFDGPREREPEEDETPEDKGTKDAEFKVKLEENKKKAEELQERLKGWVYLVAKYTVDDVLKGREDLLKEEEEEKEEEEDKESDAAKPDADADDGHGHGDADDKSHEGDDDKDK